MHSFISLSILAASTAAISLPKRDLPPSTSLPTGWEYNGCYTDSRDHRELSADFFYDMGTNTVDADTCIAYCGGKGYAAAGLEYSGECYCGPTLPVQSGTTGCSMPCAGDSAEACGGPDRLTVYTSFRTNPGPAGWTSLGCYTDSVQGRTLTVLEQVPGGTDAMTPEACTSTCAGAGYKYAGVEYAGECFCGNEISNGGALSTVGGCSMTCKGDGQQLCGGPDRINVYEAVASSPEEPTPEEPTPEEPTPVEPEPEDPTPVEPEDPATSTV